MERIRQIIYDEAFRAALDRIRELEKDRRFCRHGMDHLENVARIAWILCLEEKKDLPKDLVYGAALLHDIGRAKPDSGGQPHRVESARMALPILERAGYTKEEREEMKKAILSHGDPREDAGDLADVIYRADKLSRDCFLCPVYDECYWEEERKNKTILV